MGHGEYASPILLSRGVFVLIIVIVNRKYDNLLAAADPENRASLRVLEKAGFVKGNYRKEFYERGILGGRKSDLQCFYFPRPTALKGEKELARSSLKEIEFGVQSVETES